MEDDDMDFTPSPNTSSNLASLFGFTKKPLQGNSSLTYTPPKAPKKESSPAKKQSDEKTKGKIIFSKAIQAYKLENRTYVNQGVIGIVISGNHESRIYEIILYKRTKEHLCQIRISNSFSITLSPNNYVSFYDDKKQNWSIMFQSLVDVEQFSQKIAICKFYSCPEPPTEILVQDLGPASQQKATSTSTVEVTYNNYSLISEELTKLKGDVKKKIKLSDCSFTYFSKGLIGCAENCKRVIIIPHSLSGSWINELGPNKDLLIEVKVEKILTEESVGSETRVSSEEPPESPIDSSAEETNIKARGASIKEALAITKSQKANLISRMARMGQATLPVKQGLSGGGSDSEEECPVTSSPKPRLPRSRNTGAANANSTVPQNQEVSVYQNDLSWHQTQLNKLGLAYQQLIPVSTSPVSSPATDPNLSIYVSESRIQAAELRMGISKISDKLDLVWNKIQNISGTTTESKIHQQTLMDSGGILTGIQNLITENESLKEKVEEQKGKIEQQNDRIFHLLELNHKYLEQNSTTHEKQSANDLKLKTEMESLQKKEVEMMAANKSALDRVKNLEDELTKSEEANKDLKKKLEDLNVFVEDLKKNLDGNNDEKTKELENLKEKITISSKTVVKLKERLKEVVLENENYKSVIKAQKEEIESGNVEMKDSKNKNKEYEKTVECLKKQISEEESKNDSKIERLSKVVAKLEEEKKALIEKIERDVSLNDINQISEKILTTLKKEFSEEKEYSSSYILGTVEKILNNITQGTHEQENPPPTESPNIEPTVVPAPRTSLQNVDSPPEEKVIPIKEDKDKEEKKETESDNQKKNDEADSRYKSYDQGWRTAKPPPPPLFDDDDDDDDWLN